MDITPKPPVGYQIWRLMQERVYKTAVRCSSDLKQCLTDICASTSQNIIDEAVDQWKNRLHANEKAKRYHFERLLNKKVLFRATMAYRAYFTQLAVFRVISLSRKHGYATRHFSRCYSKEKSKQNWFSFSALTLLVGRQEGHSARKKLGVRFLVIVI